MWQYSCSSSSLLSVAPSHFVASAQSKGGDSLVMTNLSHVDCISCYLPELPSHYLFTCLMSRILLELCLRFGYMELWCVHSCVFEFGGRRFMLQFANGETYPSALIFTFLPFLDSLIGVGLSLSCMLVKPSIPTPVPRQRAKSLRLVPTPASPHCLHPPWELHNLSALLQSSTSALPSSSQKSCFK